MLSFSLPTFRSKATLPLFSALLVGSNALFLAGCSSSNTNKFAPQCPRVEVLKNAADYYNHQSGTTDFSNLITQANISTIRGDCSYTNGEQNSISTRVYLTMTIQRGPAATSRTVHIPYFVAVIHNGEIQRKYEYSQEVTFPENVSQTSVSTELAKLNLPISDNMNTTGYQIDIGFQLTEQQLNYNLAHIQPPSFKPF